MNRLMSFGIAGACALASVPAAAYIGPGAGLSLVGALWAVVVAVGAALFFILAWPVRRMLRRRREQQTGGELAAVQAAPRDSRDGR